MNYIPYLQISDNLDIKKGDILFVHHNITRLLFTAMRNGETPDINLFIDSFIEKIGPSGTLIFPTFNWDFCSGLPFDYYKTRCQTGILGATALSRADFRRTQHPIYSFAVWGKDQSLLCDMTNTSSFGEDSPFDYMYNNSARNLIIDVEYTDCFTFLHYVEEMSGVKTYRYLKPFSSSYIDAKGVESVRTYTMLVRDLKLDVINDFRTIGIEWETNSISNRQIINDIPFIMVDMHGVYKSIMDDALNNKSRKLCKYIGQ